MYLGRQGSFDMIDSVEFLQLDRSEYGRHLLLAVEHYSVVGIDPGSLAKFVPSTCQGLQEWKDSPLSCYLLTVIGEYQSQKYYHYQVFRLISLPIQSLLHKSS